MQKAIGILCILIGLSAQLKAQIIDFDALAIASDSTQDTAVWNGYVAANFDIVKQKGQLYYLRFESTISYEKKKNLMIFTGSNKTTFSDGQEVQNTGSARFKYLYNFRKKFFPEFVAQIQYDAQRGLRQRNLIGMNGVHAIINKKKHKLLVHLGAIYEEELWDYTAVPDEEIDRESTPETKLRKRTKLNFNPRYIIETSDNSTFSAVIYVQAPFSENFIRPRISPIVRFNLYIIGNLMLSSSLSGIYDFQPVVPIDNFYYTWNNSLVWRF